LGYGIDEMGIFFSIRTFVDEDFSISFGVGTILNALGVLIAGFALRFLCGDLSPL